MSSRKIKWEELKSAIYKKDGSLRDIYVFETTKTDWLIWAEYVTQRYRLTYKVYEGDIVVPLIDFEKVIGYWSGNRKNASTATFYIGNIMVNTHFFTEEEIEHDISPNDLVSEEDHNNLIGYMSNLSKLLNKKVALTYEDNPDFVLIEVRGDEVTINL